jgi:hypothetical protein
MIGNKQRTGGAIRIFCGFKVLRNMGLKAV